MRCPWNINVSKDVSHVIFPSAVGKNQSMSLTASWPTHGPANGPARHKASSLNRESKAEPPGSKAWSRNAPIDKLSKVWLMILGHYEDGSWAAVYHTFMLQSM